MSAENESGARAATTARDWLKPAIHEAGKNFDFAVSNLARQMYQRTGHGKWEEATEVENIVFMTYASIAFSVILAGIASP